MGALLESGAFVFLGTIFGFAAGVDFFALFDLLMAISFHKSMNALLPKTIQSISR